MVLNAMMQAALATAVIAAPAGAAPLDRHRWTSRVLVIAADAGDSRVLRQRRIVEEARAGLRERDLVVVEAIGRDAEAMAVRRSLSLPADGFRTVLVGKDGGAKLASEEPIAADTLFATIDAMPMRRDEAAQRRAR
ncbi:DUF4174 domain-containing protein [Methylobacterium sp. ID0610]|uniref:DUF4174 domain-containing protein n=1 Tax=Methylobacterium carpenticola TaxID=3344827 RepID=UPI003687C9C5